MAIGGSGVPVIDLKVYDGMLLTSIISNMPKEAAVSYEEAIELLSRGEWVSVEVAGGIRPLIDELYNRGIIRSKLVW